MGIKRIGKWREDQNIIIMGSMNLEEITPVTQTK